MPGPDRRHRSSTLQGHCGLAGTGLQAQAGPELAHCDGPCRGWGRSLSHPAFFM